VAKENKNIEETEVKTDAFKTVTFGGYDKNSVDYYIEELKADHEKEVNELKANVNKLSEAVLSLKTMREVNLNESNKTIDGLKSTVSEYESEIASLKEQLNAYKQKEYESAGRYESISRTLLEARESADTLIAQTNKKCEEQEAEVTARCEALERDTIEKCNALEAETNEKCNKMYEETESTCSTMKEQAYSESERTRNKAHESAEALSAKTDYECKLQKEDAQKEAESIVNQATSEAYVLRKNVKKECEAVSKYMSELLASLDGVVDACCATKDVADKAFTGLKSEATTIVGEADKEPEVTEGE
jgi:chromosome segregation ATPase